VQVSSIAEKLLFATVRIETAALTVTGIIILVLLSTWHEVAVHAAIGTNWGTKLLEKD
jgi:hypothetical protein